MKVIRCNHRLRFACLFFEGEKSSYEGCSGGELQQPPERIVCPKQICVGTGPRSYTPLDQRPDLGPRETEVHGPL